jgi:hypothetical protein
LLGSARNRREFLCRPASQSTLLLLLQPARVFGFIGTDEQLTYIFTKALGRVRFQVLRWKIKVFEVK